MFVNQTLTARTVGLVGGVLAGLALALTGPRFIFLPILYIYLLLLLSIYYHYSFVALALTGPLHNFFYLNVFVTSMLSCTLPQQVQVHSHRQAPLFGGEWVGTF